MLYLLAYHGRIVNQNLLGSIMALISALVTSFPKTARSALTYKLRGGIQRLLYGYYQLTAATPNLSKRREVVACSFLSQGNCNSHFAPLWRSGTALNLHEAAAYDPKTVPPDYLSDEIRPDKGGNKAVRLPVRNTLISHDGD